MFCPKPPLYPAYADRWDRPRPPRPHPTPATAPYSLTDHDHDKGYTTAKAIAPGAADKERAIGLFSISPGQTRGGKNLVALLASCLFILAIIIPAAGAASSDGSVTITPLKNGVYSLGDTLTFSGTNTDSGTTYLFITGPNLVPEGSQIQSTHPRTSPVIDGDASTFLAAFSSAGNRWDWTWDSRNALIDTGLYTLYATSKPRDLPHINDTQYAKVDFIMKRPANAPAATDLGSEGGNPAESVDDASVTITGPKSGRYTIGDTLTFSGTNTNSDTTYLFITGPNLVPEGSQIQSTHPGKSPVTDGDAFTFQAAGVGPDNQWSYTWNSQKTLIDAGVFTIYAASKPRDLPHINNTQFANVSLMMMRPANIESHEGYLSLPPSVVRKADTITISGTAKGNPGPGVAVWIIGAPVSGAAGYADQLIVHPDSTGSYSLVLDRATARLEEGKFHVVVQHPMQNNVFDIFLANTTAGNPADAWVLNRMLKDSSNADGTRVFKIRGAGSLQGNDAYEALVQVFEDKTVDDNIVIFPSTVNSPGSGGTEPVQQDQVPTTQYLVTGGERGNPAGSGNLLDQVFGFLSGMS